MSKRMRDLPRVVDVLPPPTGQTCSTTMHTLQKRNDVVVKESASPLLIHAPVRP